MYCSACDLPYGMHAGFCVTAVHVGSLNTVRPEGRPEFPIPLHLHAMPEN